MSAPSQLPRRVLLVLVATTASVAVMAGLARVGWAVPFGAGRTMDHGPLFVLGVFGTVIALERTVALGRPWGYAAPVLGVLGALATASGATSLGTKLALASAVALTWLNAAIVRRQSLPFTWLMLAASGVLVVGCGARELGRSVPEVVPAWLVFFVLTIVSERLELSRLAPTPRWATRLLVVLACLLVANVLLLLLRPSVSARSLGVWLALVAVWQLRFDLARRTVRTTGLPRFAAFGVLLGALWLLVGGAGLAALDLGTSGLRYDAILHAILVGFVLSMVFAHAPIILPAVSGVEVPFHTVLYAPLGLLHAGLVLRVAGDLAEGATARRVGALLDALALAALVASVLVARARSGARRRSV